MKMSTKAALYSAVIFPGAGFFLLKKYTLGLLFLIPATAAMIYVIYFSMQVASAIAERILAGHIALNVPAISTAITTALSEEGNDMLALAKIGFVLLWLTSIALCFRIGQLVDRNQRHNQLPNQLHNRPDNQPGKHPKDF